MYWLLLLLVLAVPIGAVVWRLATGDRKLPARRIRGTGLIDRFSGPPFDTGMNRRTDIRTHGEHRGRQYIAFGLSYEVPEQRDRMVTRTFTVVAVNTPAPCPDLAISRPTLRGGPDLELESEEFNKAFKIDTSDDKFAYDLLHPGMMAWLLDDGRALRMPLTFGNQDLFTYALGVVAPEEMLEFLCDVLDRVPTFVWKD